jgi:glycine betaine/proline transport system substrate-binding protein
MTALKTRLARALAGAALVLGLGGTAVADVPESTDPIIIPLNNWTGETINAAIAGQILQRLGYNVEYVAIGAIAMAPAVAEGEITYAPELWDNNLGEYWPALIAEDKIVDLGDVGIDAREGWLYPKHVEEDCPGLPAWDAFLACAELFATPDTMPNGRYLDYPAEWQSRGGDLVREEGLPFDVVPAGSEGALVAELNSAIERKAPLVMMFWAPHWSLLTVEYGWIDMPEDLVNKYSLQKPRVFKAGWPGMFDKWPVAARFIQNFTVDNATQELLMGQVDNDGMDLMEATGAWIDANPGVWQPMVDKAMEGS